MKLNINVLIIIYFLVGFFSRIYFLEFKCVQQFSIYDRCLNILS